MKIILTTTLKIIAILLVGSLIAGGLYLGLNAGASNGGVYLAVGAGGTSTVSGDGQTWTTGNAETSNDLYGLAFGNGVWVAVGARGTIVTSTDNTAWQAAVSPAAEMRAASSTKVCCSGVHSAKGVLSSPQLSQGSASTLFNASRSRKTLPRMKSRPCHWKMPKSSGFA